MANQQPSKSEKVKAEIKKEIDKIPPTSDRNLFAALSYAWVFSIIMLVIKRGDEYVQFHARQGVLLFVGSLFWWFIPPIGTLLAFLCWIGMVIGFIQAWKGHRYEMPFIYGWSQKIKL